MTFPVCDFEGGRDRIYAESVEARRESAAKSPKEECGNSVAVTERKGAIKSAATKAMPLPQEERGKLRVL